MTQELYLSNDMIIIMRMKFKIEMKRYNYDKLRFKTQNRDKMSFIMTVLHIYAFQKNQPANAV